MSSDRHLFCGQFEDEASAGFTVGSILDPYPSTVHSHVFVDKCQAEAGAVAAGSPAGHGTAREALEHE
jgi:hypothetical protein